MDQQFIQLLVYVFAGLSALALYYVVAGGDGHAVEDSDYQEVGVRDADEDEQDVGVRNAEEDEDALGTTLAFSECFPDDEIEDDAEEDDYEDVDDLERELRNSISFSRHPGQTLEASTSNVNDSHLNLFAEKLQLFNEKRDDMSKEELISVTVLLFNKATTCMCCERHQQRRPTWIGGRSRYTMSRSATNFECKCQCRHLARDIVTLVNSSSYLVDEVYSRMTTRGSFLANTVVHGEIFDGEAVCLPCDAGVILQSQPISDQDDYVEGLPYVDHEEEDSSDEDNDIVVITVDNEDDNVEDVNDDDVVVTAITANEDE